MPRLPRALLVALLALFATGASLVPEARAANEPPSCSYAPPIPPPGQGNNRLLRTTETERVDFTCTDTADDPLELAVTAPGSGALTQVTSDAGDGFVEYAATYDPAAGFVGADSFEVTVTDGQGAAVSGTYRLDVKAADYNTAPTCQTELTGGLGPRVGGEFGFQFTCSDSEGDPIALKDVAAGNASVETLDVVKNSFNEDVFVTLFVRGGTTVGPGSVTVRPYDSAPGEPSVIAFDVRTANANEAPDCSGPPREIEAGERLALGTLAAMCFDPDQDPLTAAVTEGPAHGELTIDAEGAATYRADPGYAGPDGFAYRADDAHGGVATETVTVEVTVPGATLNTIIDQAPDYTGSDTTPEFAFHSPGNPAATFECRVARYPRPAAWESCASPESLGPLEPGDYLFEVRALAGVEADDTPALHFVPVDTDAPAQPAITTRPPAVTTSRDATFALSTRVIEETHQCKLDGGDFDRCNSPRRYAGLADGAHTFTARTVDPAGNASQTTTYAWTVDTTPPAPPATTDIRAPETTIVAGPAATTTATDAAFRLSSTEAGRFECSLDGAAFAPCGDAPRVSGLKLGAHTFSARSADATGNVDATPAEHRWSVVAAPPADGPVADATPPVITLTAKAQKPKAVAKRGLVVTLGCDEPCLARISVALGGRAAGTLTLPRTTAGAVTVKLTAKAGRKLRRVRSARLAVSVVAVDTAGNASKTARSVRLRR